MELLDLHDYDLLHILHFLDKIDKISLSKTCTRLKEMCLLNWKSLTFNLGLETETNERKIRLTDDEKEILQFSGHTIQNMHISLDFSKGKEFDLDLLPLNTESSKWNLKKLSFHALNIDLPSTQESFEYNAMTPTHDLTYKYIKTIINGTFSDIGICCLNSCARLETLSLSTQCWRDDVHFYREKLLEALQTAKFRDSLKSFDLDCFFARPRWYRRRTDWYGSTVFQMTRDYRRGVGGFKNLQKLEINSAYLTNSLLKALSHPGHVSLQSLTLVLDLFFNRNITAWPKLLNASPSLQVRVESFYDVSCLGIIQTLPACVPIVGWTIYSCPRVKPYRRSILKRLFEQLRLYANTLQTLAVQTVSERMHSSDLLEMVTQCPKLRTLYLQGPIYCSAIVNAASLQRSWLKLGVLEKDIMCTMDGDTSCKNDIPGFCARVSKHLGYTWKPESEATYRTIFGRPVLR